jgi:hypothetical protein
MADRYARQALSAARPTDRVDDVDTVLRASPNEAIPFPSPGRVIMRNRRQLALLGSAALLAVGASQVVLAGDVQNRHVIRSSRADAGSPAPLLQPAVDEPLALIGLHANFTQAYPTIGANADGSDVWPCLGNGSRPDCATIGSPAVPFPRGGIVMGRPAYTFALQNNDIIGYGLGNGVGCDALVNGTNGQPYESGATYMPCGQVLTSYEDDTGDTTDDLLQRVMVKQGTKIIYDSGLVDFGPAGPIKFPVDVILYSDANFGYWPGALYGPNNGNCSGNANYPLTAAANPGTFYVVASNSTCQEPVAGPASFITYTELGTPQYTQMSGAACTSKGVASPCYTVKWTKQYEIHQNFDIFLQ